MQLTVLLSLKRIAANLQKHWKPSSFPNLPFTNPPDSPEIKKTGWSLCLCSEVENTFILQESCETQCSTPTLPARAPLGLCLSSRFPRMTTAKGKRLRTRINHNVPASAASHIKNLVTRSSAGGKVFAVILHHQNSFCGSHISVPAKIVKDFWPLHTDQGFSYRSFYKLPWKYTRSNLTLINKYTV